MSASEIPTHIQGQVCDFVVVAGRKEMFAEVKQKYPEIFGSAKLKLCKEPWFEDKLQHVLLFTSGYLLMLS